MNFLGSFLSSLKPRKDDDVIDRLNYYYTCIIILVLSITISAKQYVGQPIQCWVPAQFTGAWEQYAENYCFVQNTYWMPLGEQIPAQYSERDARQIGYYQWVPFVLAIQAMLFYMPCIIWRLLNWQSGINVQTVVGMAADSQNIHADLREKSVKTISRHIEDAIELQREFGSSHKSTMLSYAAQCGKTKGCYVSLLYLMVKFLYLFNVIGQFFLMNAFLGPRYVFWGAEILQDLLRGVEWQESGHFPRVTLCDFEVRVLGNLHRYTIQCVLMINMFNEKIFLFMWWWLVFVAIATIVNLFYWIVQTYSRQRRFAVVTRYLRVTDSITPGDRRAVSKFVSWGLRPDGVFMLRMISSHAGELAATELTHALWLNFKEKIYSPPPSLVTSSTEHTRKLPSRTTEDEGERELLLLRHGATKSSLEERLPTPPLEFMEMAPAARRPLQPPPQTPDEARFQSTV